MKNFEGDFKIFLVYFNQYSDPSVVLRLFGRVGKLKA